MSKVKELAEAHKLKVGFVGGAVVVSSIFGTCQFKPAPAEAEEEPAAEEEAPEPSKEEEPVKEESE